MEELLQNLSISISPKEYQFQNYNLCITCFNILNETHTLSPKLLHEINDLLQEFYSKFEDHLENDYKSLYHDIQVYFVYQDLDTLHTILESILDIVDEIYCNN